MTRWISAIVSVMLVLTVGAAEARQRSIAGIWTFSVENLALRFVLSQKGRNVSGTLDYPHGAPIPLKGEVVDNVLTFSGKSSGEGFRIEISATGSLESDGSLMGTLTSHVDDIDESRQVVKERHYDMTWTAVRRHE